MSSAEQQKEAEQLKRVQQQLLKAQTTIENLNKRQLHADAQAHRILTLEHFIAQTAHLSETEDVLKAGSELLLALVDIDAFLLCAAEGQDLTPVALWLASDGYLKLESSLPAFPQPLYEQCHSATLAIEDFTDSRTPVGFQYFYEVCQSAGCEGELEDFSTAAMALLTILNKEKLPLAFILALKLDPGTSGDRTLSPKIRPDLNLARNLLESTLQRIDFIKEITRNAIREKELIQEKIEEEKKTLYNLVSIAAEVSDTLNSPLAVVSNVLERVLKMSENLAEKPKNLENQVALAVSSIEKTREFLARLRDLSNEIETTKTFEQGSVLKRPK